MKVGIQGSLDDISEIVLDELRLTLKTLTTTKEAKSLGSYQHHVQTSSNMGLP